MVKARIASMFAIALLVGLLASGCLPLTSRQSEADLLHRIRSQATFEYLNAVGELEKKYTRYLDDSRQANNPKEAARHFRTLAAEIVALPTKHVDDRLLAWTAKYLEVLSQMAAFLDELADHSNLGRAVLKGFAGAIADILLFGGVPIISGGLVYEEFQRAGALEEHALSLQRKIHTLESERTRLIFELKTLYHWS
ncbi:MAG: hypothetical protein RML93_10220 [Anaerolineales bacterium]|nr:hypothetical protein [Anaerolineales bacterium]MDW8447650.1 hypothetical protein [Anaerolineales bacterium]